MISFWIYVKGKSTPKDQFLGKVTVRISATPSPIIYNGNVQMNNFFFGRALLMVIHTFFLEGFLCWWCVSRGCLCWCSFASSSLCRSLCWRRSLCRGSPFCFSSRRGLCRFSSACFRLFGRLRHPVCPIPWQIYGISLAIFVKVNSMVKRIGNSLFKRAEGVTCAHLW